MVRRYIVTRHVAKSLAFERHTKVSCLLGFATATSLDDFKTCESVSMKEINLFCSHSSQAIV